MSGEASIAKIDSGPITVSRPVPLNPPTWVDASIPDGTVGAAFSDGVEAAAGDSGTPSLSASGLPAGLSLVDNGDGTGTVSGTPTASEDATVTFTADDGTLTAQATDAVAISPDVATSISTTPGDSQVVLSWTDPADTALTGVEIHRSTSSGFTPSGSTLVATASPGDEGYTDDGSGALAAPSNGTTYYYVLRSVGGDSLTNDAGEVSATPTDAFDYSTYSGYTLDIDPSQDVYEDAAATDPAEVGDAVASLIDQASSMVFDEQGTSARPVLRETGGVRYLELDGTDDLLEATDYADSWSDVVLFLVVNRLSMTSEAFFEAYTGGDASGYVTNDGFVVYQDLGNVRLAFGGSARATRSLPPSTRVVVTARISSSSSSLRVNDDAAATGSGASMPLNPTILQPVDSAARESFRVLLYNANLSSGDEQAIRDQLYSDYSITP